jgi:hypothetical protein
LQHQEASDLLLSYLQTKLFFHSFLSLKYSFALVGLQLYRLPFSQLPSCPARLRYLITLFPFLDPILGLGLSLFRSQYFVVQSLYL